MKIIDTTLNIVITILAFSVTITYIFSILFGATYTLELTKEISNVTEVPALNRIPLFIFMIPVGVELPYTISIEALSQIFIIIYVIFLTLAMTRRENMISAIKNMEYKINDIIATVTYMSLILVLMISIDFLQQSAGIESGELEAPNEFIKFVTALIAPLIEEIGFRLTTIGIAVLVLYIIMSSTKISIKNMLIALWRPLEAYKDERGRYSLIVYIIVVIAGTSFGLAHILSGAGWDIGKVTTASLAGIVIGYVYIKYGFHSAVLGHSFFNIYLLSLYYIGTYTDTYISFITDIIYIQVLILGVAALGHICINYISKKVT